MKKKKSIAEKKEKVAARKKRKAIEAKRLTCPACGAEAYNSILSKTLGRTVSRWNSGSLIDRESLINRQGWACDNCIESGNAIPADTHAQVYCCSVPYLAYLDVHRECKNCGSTYIFAKEEQKYWYEILFFHIESRPKHCPACRATIRKARNLNTALSTLLKNKAQLTADNALKLSEIYSSMNKPEKAKHYNTLFRKLSLRNNAQHS